MASEDELWALVQQESQGVLATVARDGRPQLSNVLYVADPRNKVVRISTTAGRVKARNLARDPRAALHVTGRDFWQYAVAEGTTTLSAVAATPGDEACRELLAVHSAFYGEQDPAAFDQEMITNGRLVVRLQIGHLYGVIATGGRRPARRPAGPPLAGNSPS
jgi:PPOX class probable F420-dependent enzyme